MARFFFIFHALSFELNFFRPEVPFKRTCEANATSENSSFIFTVCVKSVPRCHFKLAHVVLQMAVKEFFETHFQSKQCLGCLAVEKIYVAGYS